MGRGPRSNQSITASSLLFGPRHSRQKRKDLIIHNWQDLIDHRAGLFHKLGQGQVADIIFNLAGQQKDDEEIIEEARKYVADNYGRTVNYFAPKTSKVELFRNQRLDKGLSEKDIDRIQAAQYNCAFDLAKEISDGSQITYSQASEKIQASFERTLVNCAKSKLAKTVCVYGVDPLDLSDMICDYDNWKSYENILNDADLLSISGEISEKKKWMHAAELIATVMAATISHNEDAILSPAAPYAAGTLSERKDWVKFDNSSLQKQPQSDKKMRWILTPDCAAKLSKANSLRRRLKNEERVFNTLPAADPSLINFRDLDFVDQVVKQVAYARGMNEVATRQCVAAVGKNFKQFSDNQGDFEKTKMFYFDYIPTDKTLGPLANKSRPPLPGRLRKLF